MSNNYITTNVRLPRSLHKTLKRRALEEEKSFAELIRNALIRYDADIRVNSKQADVKGKGAKKQIKTIADLAKLAEPMGGDLSSNIDKIVYGAGNR
jgi:hypothetical protein